MIYIRVVTGLRRPGNRNIPEGRNFFGFIILWQKGIPQCMPHAGRTLTEDITGGHWLYSGELQENNLRNLHRLFPYNS